MLKKVLTCSLISILILSNSVIVFADDQPTLPVAGDYVEGEVLVKFSERKLDLDGGVGYGLLNLIEEDQNVQIDTVVANENIALIKSENGLSTFDLINELEQNPFVEIVSPNFIRRLSQVPNDTCFSFNPDPEDECNNNYQWYLENTGQSSGTVGADIDFVAANDILDVEELDEVIVAVIDSGVNYNHQDFANRMWDGGDECTVTTYDGNSFAELVTACPYHGWDFVDNDDDPFDDIDLENAFDGHGTHVAGLIAANSNNAIGIAGVSRNSKIMALRAFGTNGSATLLEILLSIYFAIDNGADVINASYGGSLTKYLFENPNQNFEYLALKEFTDNGGIVVAAAGNFNEDNDSLETFTEIINGSPVEFTIAQFPASYDLDGVISVGASNRTDTMSSFSNFGECSVDVFAPGSSILSLRHDLNDDTGTKSGTSFAAPIVTGIAASLIGQGLFGTSVKHNLIGNSELVEALSGRSLSSGRVNLATSIQALDPEDRSLPIVGFSEPSAIPAEQITRNEDGTFTFNVRISDERYKNIEVFLSGFNISYDSGENFISVNRNLITTKHTCLKTDLGFEGEIYSFTFDPKLEDFEAADQFDSESVVISMEVSNTLLSSELALSEPFRIDLKSPNAVTLNGVPTTGTTSRTANVSVVSPTGEGVEEVVAYRYKLNNGAYSEEFAMDVPISLSGLSTSAQTLLVEGRDVNGNFQLVPTTVSWTIATAPSGGGGGGSPSSATTESEDDKKDEEEVESTNDEEKEIVRTLFDAPKFTDVSQHWSNQFVQELASLGVVQGKEAGKFFPDDNLTRAEMLKIALLSFGISELQGNAINPFNDVKVGSDWFANFALIAFEREIVQGFSDNTFRPNNQITRAEALKILLEASELNLDSSTTLQFSDVNSTDWFYKYVRFAFANKIVSGKTPLTFAPNDPITRAEMAKIAVLTLK